MKIWKIFIILVLVCATFVMYYKITGNIYDDVESTIFEVVDGDTVDTSLGKVRLLGINTPEKNQPYYGEAKEFLKKFENKSVVLEIVGRDKYNRNLAYVFYNERLVNQQILSEGFASLYYYDRDKYYERMKKSEEFARINEKELWKKSSRYSCLSLVKLKYEEDGKRCTNQEQIILNNFCSEMRVIIKDDANHIEELNLPEGIFMKNYSCVWNDDGDSLFIRDKEGLILFYRY